MALTALRELGPVQAQRIHGDLHVAQFLRSPIGLVVVDWEGEPGKSLAERGRPLPTARDLGSLRLSLAHAARAAHRRNDRSSTGARGRSTHASERSSPTRS